MKLRSLNKIEHAVLMCIVQVVAQQISDGESPLLKKLITKGINPVQIAQDLAQELGHSAVFLLAKEELEREEREETAAIDSLKEGFAA